MPSQLTPLPTPAATTSITPQTLSTPLSSLPLICRPRSPHSPTITSSPRQTPASSLWQSSFLLHGHSHMERALQTAHKSTTPSPLSPNRKPLPPLLPAPPSPSPSTSPPLHTSTLHSDQAASSLHGRTRSLREIYEATSFSAVLTNESTLEHLQEPLEDALPLSVHDALASSESKEWHVAILDELQALEAANTWELVPPPEHHNIVSCKWLLKKKYHPNGSVDRYKARLVARGFTQQEGVDYFDIYSPVLGLFVDDIPLLGTSEYMLLQAIDCISREYPMTDKGPMTYFLGIEVIRDPAGKFIQLSQSKYIEELLLFYGMSASAPELTPLPVKHKLAPEFHAYTRTDALYCPSFHFPKFCGQ
ncbi:hypothetical protein L7F22_028351 [Adiantum nelumboides]|nr:hypothetical protein [Adiantum nelumboides]